MTTIFLTTINCPKCNASNVFERYDKIVANQSPELTQAIIDWELLKYTCMHCEHQVLITYPTIYIDCTKMVAIQYSPERNNGSEIRDFSLQNMEGVTDEYRCRIVSNLEDFAEKVQIFESGFDDRAIELMKYVNSPLEETDINFEYEHIIFTEVGPLNYQFMFVNRSEVIASLNFSGELYSRFLCEVGRYNFNNFIVDSIWAEKFLTNT